MNQQIPQGPENSQFESGKGAAGNFPAGSSMKQSVQQATEKLKTKATEVTSSASQKGQEYADKTRQTAADKLEHVSSSVRQTTEKLQQEDPNIAHYTRICADKLQDAANYIRGRNVSELKQDAEELARRHPAVFYGGMFVLGMAAARFLKASVESREFEHAEFTPEKLHEREHTAMPGTPATPQTAIEPEFPSHPVPTL